MSVGSGRGRLRDRDVGTGRSMPVGIGKSKEIVVSVGRGRGKLKDIEDGMSPRLALVSSSSEMNGPDSPSVGSIVGSIVGIEMDGTEMDGMLMEVGSAGSSSVGSIVGSIVGSEMDGIEIDVGTGTSRDMDVATEIDVGMSAACIDAARASVTRSLLNIVDSR